LTQRKITETWGVNSKYRGEKDISQQSILSTRINLKKEERKRIPDLTRGQAKRGREIDNGG